MDSKACRILSAGSYVVRSSALVGNKKNLRRPIVHLLTHDPTLGVESRKAGQICETEQDARPAPPVWRV